MMKKDFEISKKQVLSAIFLIFVIMFLSSTYIRQSKHHALIGDESYHHLNMAEKIDPSSIPETDDSSYMVQAYYFNLTDYILSFFKNKQAFMIFSYGLLGIFSLFLFYLILTEYGVSEKQKFFSCVLLILSPPFIYTFSSYSNLIFLVTLNLLFAYFYLKNQNTLAFLSIIPTIFISLPSILASLFVVFLIESFGDNNKRKAYTFSIYLLSLSTIIYFIYYYPSFIPNKLYFLNKNILIDTISDLGADVGFSIFQAILAMIGIFVLRVKQKKFRYYISLMIAFLLSAFFSFILILLNFLIVFLASTALFEVYNKKWEIEVLRNITIILIVYGIIFSAFSFQTRLINSSPKIDEVNALEFLKTQQNTQVLSHYNNGYFIEQIAKKQATIDKRIFFAKQGPQRLEEINNLFSSRNLEETRTQLLLTDIDYIYITPDMKEGLVWDKRNQGLLFLLDHSSRDFERIYSSGGVEIWKVKT